MKRDERRDPLDLVLAQGAQHSRRRLLTVEVPDDQLGEHRVVHRRHLGARLDPGVDPHPGSRRLAIAGDPPGGGRVVLVGGLRVDPALDRVATKLDVLLRDRELLARGDPDLLPHDVEAGDHLSDAVLHLDPGVHFEEEVVLADLEPLHGPGGAIADRGRRVGGDLADSLAHLFVDLGSGRLLDQLLVAALDRAVALAEVDDAALRVGEDLDLYVPRVLQVSLEVDGRVAEEPLALAGGALEGLLELVLALGDAKALAAASAGRLAGDRVSDLLGLLLRLLHVPDGLGGARDDRHAGLLHDLARLRLRSHRLDRLGRRTDPGDLRLLEAAANGAFSARNP